MASDLDKHTGANEGSSSCEVAEQLEAPANLFYGTRSGGMEEFLQGLPEAPWHPIWTSTQELTKVHLLVKWLNSLKRLPTSFMERDLEAWKSSYRAYLKRHGMYPLGTTSRMDGEQRPRVSPRDSAYISTLRQVYLLLGNAYDDRPEQDKDIWDLKLMSKDHNPTHYFSTMNFLKVKQPWLRAAVKSY